VLIGHCRTCDPLVMPDGRAAWASRLARWVWNVRRAASSTAQTAYDAAASGAYPGLYPDDYFFFEASGYDIGACRAILTGRPLRDGLP
jgi:hypothetical protein